MYKVIARLRCFILDLFTVCQSAILKVTEYRSSELHWSFHKPVVIMTNRDSTKAFTHKRKNGTDWIRSGKTNAFLSLRIRRKMVLSTLQVSTTSSPKALFVWGSLYNLFHLSRKVVVEVQENLSYGSAPGSVATYSEQYPRFKGDSHPQKHSALSSTPNYQSLTSSAFFKRNKITLPTKFLKNYIYIYNVCLYIWTYGKMFMYICIYMNIFPYVPCVVYTYIWTFFPYDSV